MCSADEGATNTSKAPQPVPPALRAGQRTRPRPRLCLFSVAASLEGPLISGPGPKRCSRVTTNRKETTEDAGNRILRAILRLRVRGCRQLGVCRPLQRLVAGWATGSQVSFLTRNVRCLKEKTRWKDVEKDAWNGSTLRWRAVQSGTSAQEGSPGGPEQHSVNIISAHHRIHHGPPRM